MKSAVVKKKMGRPIIGKPKDIRLEIRIDEETLNTLDELAKEKGVTRAEFIRFLIKSAK